MPASAEARSAGSRRGHERRAIRKAIRDAYLLDLATRGNPFEGDEPTIAELADWVADNLPDDVIDAIEASKETNR